MAGRDITEEIAVPIGVATTTGLWQNTDVAYDVALGGLPFIYAISDARPYTRQTAPFRKDQFDNGAEPGEQSLTGWWLRSQMSFHSGTGIKFFDPATTDENGKYRFADSKGVDVWTKGETTLLKSVSNAHITTGAIRSNGRPFQSVRSIEWNGNKGVLLHDEYDVDKVDLTGTETHFINYNAGVDAAVYSICDDGTTAYWITNSSTKKEVYKKALTLDYTTAGTLMFDEIGLISNAIMEYVKERIVLCADNKVYEFSGAAVAMPTPVYTHPVASHVYTSITASGPAIYIAGYNGIQSTIQKFTLSTAGVMPTLTSAVVAAERSSEVNKGNTHSSKINRLAADTLRRVLIQEEAIRLRNVTEALVAKAESGDVSAIKEVFDRMDGKSVATTEITGLDGSNLPISIGINFVKPDDSNIS